jgi:hypothetical protein
LFVGIATGGEQHGTKQWACQTKALHHYHVKVKQLICAADSSQVFRVIIKQAITSYDRTSSDVNERVLMGDHQEYCLSYLEKHEEKLSKLDTRLCRRCEGKGV